MLPVRSSSVHFVSVASKVFSNSDSESTAMIGASRGSTTLQHWIGDHRMERLQQDDDRFEGSAIKPGVTV